MNPTDKPKWHQDERVRGFAAILFSFLVIILTLIGIGKVVEAIQALP